MALIDVYNTRRNNGLLKARMEAAVANYANYVLGNVAASAPAKAWAAAVIPGDNAQIEVDAIMWAVILDPTITGKEDNATDDAVKAAVEYALQRFRIPAA